MKKPICKFCLYDIIGSLNADQFFLFDMNIINGLFADNLNVKMWFDNFYYIYPDDSSLPSFALDKYIKQHYANFVPITFDRDMLDNDLDTYARNIRDRIVSPFLIEHADSIARYIEIYNVEYNPIDNYDKHSTITTEKQGTETNTDIFAQGKTTNVIGGKTTTETGKNAPYEISSDFVNDTKTEVSESGNTDTMITDAKTDAHKLEFTDRKDIVIEHTHGNIGVTTSAQMLSGNADFWNAYNIIKFIMEMFIKECCILIDED